MTNKKKKDHPMNSKIPKFGVKLMNMLTIYSCFETQKFSKKCMAPGHFAELSGSHTLFFFWAGMVGAVGKITAFRPHGPQFDSRLCRDLN